MIANLNARKWKVCALRIHVDDSWIPKKSIVDISIQKCPTIFGHTIQKPNYWTYFLSQKAFDAMKQEELQQIRGLYIYCHNIPCTVLSTEQIYGNKSERYVQQTDHKWFGRPWARQSWTL